ncbi:hypothetical protein MO973_26650 [Paenibacillus sp. TRM 82003]|nr:hypothetical protein [Paenibacillus sp. TRM 82003]
MFTRWESTPGSTLSHRLFKQHHNEINGLYWSHMLAAKRTLNTVGKADKRLRPTTVFTVPRKHLKKIAPTLERWEKDYKDFNNWVRLSASVAINSYMEIYLRNISTLAIESNPGLIIGAPGAIDGVTLLKTREGYSYSEYAVHFTKGDWNTRIQHFERLFGEAPAKLKEYAKELNELRRMRNGVGHSFGRSTEDYETGLNLELKPMMRLSEDRFGFWLRMADEVTEAIDEHLKRGHIGQYERLLYYHSWLSRQDGKRNAGDPEALRKAYLEDTGESLEREYVQELIEYYHSC